MDVLKQIENLGIVPVVKIDDAKDAVSLAQALIDGGLPVAEITFRTDAAEESIKRIASTLPDILVGAGTVLTVDQAKRATKAGAKFIVTPGFSKPVVTFCIEHKIPINPGIATPTEIQMALDSGINVVKFFPASIFGGLKALKAMSAPYTKVKFIPTGGINADNLVEYIMFPKVFAVGGSWMVKADLIKEGEFAKITKMTREAIDTMLGFELGHIGINTANAKTSLKISKQISSIFNMPIKKGNSSNFAGKGIEVIKSKGLGTNGHIAISTNTITRAIAFLERKNIAVDMSTAKESATGSLAAVYLKDEFGGFAVHLLQKKGI